MCNILDRDGNIIHKCHNLRAIRDYIPNHLVKLVDISEIGKGEGMLSILFEDKSSFQCQFASFEVLKQSIQGWLNLRGYSLTVNGSESGIIGYNNPLLQ